MEICGCSQMDQRCLSNHEMIQLKKIKQTMLPPLNQIVSFDQQIILKSPEYKALFYLEEAW